MRRILLSAIPAILLFSCQSKPKPFVKGPHDPKEYIDVNSHLVFEAREVMQTPYFMYRISVTDGKRDSVLVSNQDLAKWQTAFLTHNILAKDTGTWYKESTFGDTSTGYITTNYTSENPDLPVRSIDVMSNPENGFIKRIYIDKTYGNADSSVTEKLGWVAGKSIIVNRDIRYKNGKSSRQENQLFWL